MRTRRPATARAAVALGLGAAASTALGIAETSPWRFVALDGTGTLILLALAVVAVLAGLLAIRALIVLAGVLFVAAAVVQLAHLTWAGANPFGGNGSTMSLLLAFGAGLLALGLAPAPLPAASATAPSAPRSPEGRPGAGVTELLLTGGEPFLLPELDRIVAHCAGVLPTTLLTNGMLFRGHRLDTLRAMPRDRLALQISLDSATPGLHDAHRGAGTWDRAVAGIRTAVGEGFTVRVAATLTTDDRHEEAELRMFLDSLGIRRHDQVVRPLAREGAAENGLELTTETLIPEITVTAGGVYWHPVAADDEEQLVTRDIFPLDAAVDLVRERYRGYREHADAAARSFPCA